LARAWNTILIAGPTASGKSAFALEMAEKTGGVIVNADSMQVYDILNVLTARPGKDELARVPHRLYGHVSPVRNYSAAAWLADVKTLLENEEFSERTVIFTGGTGLYFVALEGGLSDIPEIPANVRERWRFRLAEDGPGKLHRLLRQADPDAAASIKGGDGQRIVRALEVLEATGKPISHWHSRASEPLIDPRHTRKIMIMPERAVLNARIEKRFDGMISAGAIEEVRAMLALGLDPAMPAMKAIGVRELASAIEGTVSLEDAIVHAKTATRQYAKRQMTWFRNKSGHDWEIREP
jgi:tRNA dimethylallyltransferase